MDSIIPKQGLSNIISIILSFIVSFLIYINLMGIPVKFIIKLGKHHF